MDTPESSAAEEGSAPTLQDSDQGEPAQIKNQKGIGQGREAVEEDRGEAKVAHPFHAAGGVG